MQSKTGKHQRRNKTEEAKLNKNAQGTGTVTREDLNKGASLTET